MAPFSEIFLAIINSVGERTSISRVNYGAFLPLEKREKISKYIQLTEDSTLNIGHNGVKLCNSNLWQKRKLGGLFNFFAELSSLSHESRQKRRIVTELCISCAYQAFFAISSSTYYMTEISTFENEVSFLQKVSTHSFLQNLLKTLFSMLLNVCDCCSENRMCIIAFCWPKVSWKLLVTKVYSSFSQYHTCCHII